ncbi:acetyl/propionyl/methylcrotonyl-CoA carboxylase subunit alpha [Corynebacterium otitidis]|uniref:biotin carboxylase n=1 Tax=Corynebacterium otitidis ATCC 51513 TaxID=883169 RepID=I7KIF1_9CORY|nr:biotin carboxylase N-terminal domain-containing protein [Corynebacterium otitidis]EJZ82665.1 hypothetical protein HMPREF9719_00396 [Corynebacterium otitidis ATCC 51513]CCI82905.1 biotin carboxylase [Corynebacterium otitidis ATCC 51513]
MAESGEFPLRRVLIANRGEIAARVARAARDLGIESVAVYSEPDAGALHTRVADEAYALPGSSSAETYLNIPALLEVAERAGADCVHPGYGFLSENPDFARAVSDAGLTWIGPSAETIEKLGDKITARTLAEKVGAPLAPGTDEPMSSFEEARDFADEHGLPIAIKAAFGGGGRGLKVVENREDIEDAFASAGREAKEAFGREECFVEKFLTHPRHVEAQVLADSHGHVVVAGLRDCSTQRRFQKLIEEAPAPFLTDEQRRDITEGAREICRAAGYLGAGTVEYIVAEDGTVSFLEVNTRVQVEHPITEETSGVDVVAEQFRAAAGLPLSITEDPTPRGHAFEFRINAEDVANGFAPCPGKVTEFTVPTGPGIRVDSGVAAGDSVPPYYDSLMAKLVVTGPDRDTALKRARAALAEFTIRGVRSVLPFHRDMVTHPALVGDSLSVYTDWVDKEYEPTLEPGVDIAEVNEEREYLAVEIDGRLHRIGVPTRLLAAGPAPAGAADGSDDSGKSAAGGDNAVTAPYDGTLTSWKAADGDEVAEGDVVATFEAMKMEHSLTAPKAGTLKRVAAEGDRLSSGETIAEIS